MTGPNELPKAVYLSDKDYRQSDPSIQRCLSLRRWECTLASLRQPLRSHVDCSVPTASLDAEARRLIGKH